LVIAYVNGNHWVAYCISALQKVCKDSWFLAESFTKNFKSLLLLLGGFFLFKKPRMEIDSKLTNHLRRYLIQSSYVAATVFFITITSSNSTVIIASIGATAFIVFAMLNNIAAEPKHITRVHFLGFFIGSSFAVFSFMDVVLFKALWFSLSVGITILFMIVLVLEHHPNDWDSFGDNADYL
jgi:hypothetical protein